MDAATIDSQIGPTCGLQELAIFSGSGYTTWLPATGGNLHVGPDQGVWLSCRQPTVWTPS
jgi:hypothetical protein